MKRIWRRYKADFKKLNKRAGNSIPVVLAIILVVMIIGSAVAYNTMQLFSIVRNEEHNQMTYIAAESAIERIMSILDYYLANEDFATDRGITYSNETQFINDIVSKLNAGDAEIIVNHNIPVYADASKNGANVNISFSWDGTYERIGNKLRFPLEITAAADMENGMFRSYDRKSVAVKEFEVWIYKPFLLNGAIYTLGDLVAKGSGTSTIKGDVYVFGTGLDKPNRMEQYYMGGICATDSAILHIKEGSAYTRNLVRVGTFDEETVRECAIIVDRDVVAEGIQAFGYNDSIVVIRDAYTFDDIEMNGSNSYIAVNGNYFGLNQGDGNFHDTSSAVVNTAPLYSGGYVDGFTQSRIVINGSAFVNGSTFVMEVESGRAHYQIEDVALAWEGNQPIYKTNPYSNTREYIDDLIARGGNGFSVLLGDVGWTKNEGLSSDWTKWNDWISEIRSRASGRSNTLPIIPDKIKGLCHHAMAANSKIYFSNEEDFEIPDSIECRIGYNVDGLDPFLLNDYLNPDWAEYTSRSEGLPKGLSVLMDYLKGHVQVFARKDYPDSVSEAVEYKFNLGMLPGGSSELESTTEFLRIKGELDNIDTEKWDCVIKFREGGGTTPVNLIQYMKEKSLDPTDYFLIINLNPERELIIEQIETEGEEEEGEEEEDSECIINGIIFTMGKITIRDGATVNGAIIAAGRGYDPHTNVEGSAADSYGEGIPRLPRIVENSNIENFKKWDYAALVFENGGGNVCFLGRDELFDNFTEEKDGVKFSEILRGIF